MRSVGKPIGFIEPSKVRPPFGEEEEGAGLGDYWNALKDKAKTILGYNKYEYTTKVKNFIEDHKDSVITELTIYRTPVISFVKTMANVLSLGKFNKILKDQYDDVFHLFVLVTLSTGERFILEKNQVIQINEFNSATIKDAKTFPLQIPQGITFSQFMDKGRNSVSKEEFFLYDALTYNCQRFIQILLKANGILEMNPGANQFVFQDLTKMRNELSSTSKGIMRGITDVAAYVSRVKGSALEDESDDIEGGRLPTRFIEPGDIDRNMDDLVNEIDGIKYWDTAFNHTGREAPGQDLQNIGGEIEALFAYNWYFGRNNIPPNITSETRSDIEIINIIRKGVLDQGVDPREQTYYRGFVPPLSPDRPVDEYINDSYLEAPYYYRRKRNPGAIITMTRDICTHQKDPNYSAFVSASTSPQTAINFCVYRALLEFEKQTKLRTVLTTLYRIKSKRGIHLSNIQYSGVDYSRFFPGTSREENLLRGWHSKAISGYDEIVIPIKLKNDEVIQVIPITISVQERPTPRERDRIRDELDRTVDYVRITVPQGVLVPLTDDAENKKELESVSNSIALIQAYVNQYIYTVTHQYTPEGVLINVPIRYTFLDAIAKRTRNLDDIVLSPQPSPRASRVPTPWDNMAANAVTPSPTESPPPPSPEPPLPAIPRPIPRRPPPP
jgi:hypothetical protein